MVRGRFIPSVVIIFCLLAIFCLSARAFENIDCGNFLIEDLPGESDVNEIKDDDKEDCDSMVTGDITKNKYRYKILKHLNSIRSRIAVGCGVQKDSVRLPEALNMLRVAYSCEMEQAAAAEVAKCPKISALVSHPDYNTIGFNEIKDDDKRTDSTYYRAIHSVYNYVKTRNTWTYNPNTMLLDDKFSAPGTKIAAAGLSASIKRIGCAYKVCGGDGKYDHNVICFTEPKINMTVSLPPLYEPGPSCNYNSECTKEDYTNCDRKLNLCTTDEDEDGLGTWGSGATSHSIFMILGVTVGMFLLNRI